MTRFTVFCPKMQIFLKITVLKFCAFFSNFHSPNSPSNLNPVDFKLKLSLIQPSDETCGFRPYLSSFVTLEENVGQSYPGMGSQTYPELLIGS